MATSLFHFGSPFLQLNNADLAKGEKNMDDFVTKLKWEGQIVRIDRVMNENDLKYHFEAKTITFKNMVVGRKDEDKRFWAL